MSRPHITLQLTGGAPFRAVRVKLPCYIFTLEMEMKTPEILLPALRQYQHNDGSGLLAGFDHDETSRLGF